MSDIEREKPAIANGYEFQAKDAVLTMRISKALLDRIKEEADRHNMNYQKLVRLILENELTKS